MTIRLNIQVIRNKLIFLEYVQNIIWNVPKNPPGGNFTIQDGRQIHFVLQGQ